MPELGQALFGNKWEDVEAPDFIARDLYTLSEMLGHLRPDDQAHGVFGGSWGYGQDFDNSVFAMFPYWWGDCECGYEERERGWHEAHEHAEGCYQTEMRRLGLDDYHARRDREGELEALCERHGVTYPFGSMVHCTCDYQPRWQAWDAENDHEGWCPVVRPNFLHKRSGLAVHWYKYIGRSMTANCEVSFGEWQDIYDECRASLRPR